MVTNLALFVLLMQFPVPGSEIYEARTPSVAIYPTIPGPIETEVVPKMTKKPQVRKVVKKSKKPRIERIKRISIRLIRSVRG